MHITPSWADLTMVDISTVGIVSVPKNTALETFRRDLAEYVPFGISTLLVVEQSSLENRSRGRLCDTHRKVRPNVRGVYCIRSRNSAPSRKGCVVKGQMSEASSK